MPPNFYPRFIPQLLLDVARQEVGQLTLIERGSSDLPDHPEGFYCTALHTTLTTAGLKN